MLFWTYKTNKQTNLIEVLKINVKKITKKLQMTNQENHLENFVIGSTKEACKDLEDVCEMG